nr:MAG TPA: hypothetical protein [Caudoviricetes sp.]
MKPHDKCHALCYNRRDDNLYPQHALRVLVVLRVL